MIGKKWLLIITLGMAAWTHAWGQYEIDRDFDMTPFYARCRGNLGCMIPNWGRVPG